MSGKSLKSEYAKWLWILAVADVVAVWVFLVPGAPSADSFGEPGRWRLLATVVAPVVVLLIINVLPHKVKAMLVYWKPLGWLPGSQAFTRYAPADPRINMQSLTKNVGSLPTSDADQNSRWYQLYKLVENEPEITEAHRSFLMYRDMAVFSLPFAALAPACLYFYGASPQAQWLGAGIFAAQYALTAISGRHSGIRFVTNVLAVHSAQKVPGSTRKA